MRMTNTHKLLNAIIALILCAAVIFPLASCSPRPEPDPDAQSAVSSSSAAVSSSLSSSRPAVQAGLVFANALPIPIKASEQGVAVKLTEMVREKYALNPDSFGWLQVPDTTVDSIVMYRPPTSPNPTADEKFYYERRDFDGVPNTGPLATRYGTVFIDYRSEISSPGRAGLPRNTVVYGHSMEDDPDGGGFSQFKKFLDEDFAKTHPYIYFSTADEDMVWEVFAVFYTTVNLAYNTPQMTDAEFSEMMSECLKRSIWNYETSINANDKILTISTCTYVQQASYPNKYRYVVMAKLVKQGQVLASEAVLTKNPSPKAP